MKPLFYLVLIAMISLCSCATKVRYVPVPEVRRDSIHIITRAIDSVHVADTVVLRDTVPVYRSRTVTRLQRMVDTVTRMRVDTVPVIVEVPAPANTMGRHLTDLLIAVILVGLSVYVLKKTLKH